MPKLLAQFLQEQQEPFALDVYLLERGYPIGTSLSAGRNSARTSKRRPAVPTCSRFVRAVFSRLVLHNNHKITSNGNGGGKDTATTNNQEHAEVDEFSSEIGTTQYNSCSESDVEDAESSENGSLEVEFKLAGRERKLKWRSAKEESNKQLSPVSVLEETESDEEQYNIKTGQGESSTSISDQYKPTYQELQELVDSNSCADQYTINKKALQETKQLMIDCVRELIESHRRRDGKNGEQLKKILGAEELWKLVCENVWLWSQDSIDETNLVHLLHCDFMASAEEWNSAFEQQKQEIPMEIGDAILKDLINEIVTC